MINKVTLIGNLGKTPEVKYLEGNLAVCRLSVATNESYKDKAGDWKTITEWHSVVAWRQLAERCGKLVTGQTVYVEGKLTHKKYTDKDGNERYSTDVVAQTIRLLDKKDSTSKPDATPQDAPPTESEGSYDDLPF